MPIISEFKYKPPWYLLNGHLQTVAPFLSDKRENDLYDTERLELPDGDFLDIDWMKKDTSNELMILTHGVEGNSRSYYIKEVAKYFSKRGWEIAAWNLRGCSREVNRLLQGYHAGETEDLSQVITHCTHKKEYTKIVLVGFSIGGSITLKWLGSNQIQNQVDAAITFSVPCDAKDCIAQLSRPINRAYEQKFLTKLKNKLGKKMNQYPEAITLEKLDAVKTLAQFNEYFTAPIHGFANVDELYASGNCLADLRSITVPTLLVNAKNDPILGKKCYPIKEAESNPLFFLEIPKHGGHTGFSKSRGGSWIPERVEQFLNQHLG